jgi:predicted RNase H-like HicB family nuclease
LTGTRPTRHDQSMNLTVELEREADGRWIAEVRELAGVLAYGATRELAIAAAQALAFRVLADRIEHGEASADSVSRVAFVTADAA